MFTQRKTDSYDLVGTNARNSNCSIESQSNAQYGADLINQIGFENIDYSIVEQIFLPCHSQIGLRKSSILHVDPEDFLNNSCQRKIQYTFLQDDFMFEMPFEFKNSFHKNSEDIIEINDSTHDTQDTGSSSSSNKKNKFILSASNSDHEDMVDDDMKIDKLMRDLEFIAQPLVPKMSKSKKASDCLYESLQSSKELENDEDMIDEEKRRRKNKEQVQILINEYFKNSNWTRASMKDLAKRVGLKSSQVYKWNWDQKKKEVDEQKQKRLFYPNEIFQVLDKKGNNITKPVFQKFLVKQMKMC